MNAFHHRITIGPSPEVAYFGRAAFREGRSTLAALGATREGTPAGVDCKAETKGHLSLKQIHSKFRLSAH